MFELFSEWLSDALKELLNPILELVTKGLVQTAFYPEDTISKALPALDIFHGGGIYTVTLIMGISLVLLKFLKKGFDTYILWLDGDADADPFNSLINLAKALVIAICFPTVYNYLAKITTVFTEKLLKVSGGDINIFSSNPGTLIMDLTAGTFFNLLIITVYIVLFAILYIRFIMVALELFVLRCGVPLACVGLIDSNGGVWVSYANKLVQCCLAIIIQIFLMYISIWLLLSKGISPVWGIATVAMALRSPKFLQEFLIVPQNMNMNAVMHNTQMGMRGVAGISKILRR